MFLQKLALVLILTLDLFIFLGKGCEVNLNDCPGSCKMQYTKLTIDKIAECECICFDGYTGIDCTVNMLTKYYKSVGLSILLGGLVDQSKALNKR